MTDLMSLCHISKREPREDRSQVGIVACRSPLFVSDYARRAARRQFVAARLSTPLIAQPPDRFGESELTQPAKPRPTSSTAC